MARAYCSATTGLYAAEPLPKDGVPAAPSPDSPWACWRFHISFRLFQPIVQRSGLPCAHTFNSHGRFSAVSTYTDPICTVDIDAVIDRPMKERHLNQMILVTVFLSILFGADRKGTKVIPPWINPLQQTLDPSIHPATLGR